jgi:hypothetical protein
MRDRRQAPKRHWLALVALAGALVGGCQSELLSFPSLTGGEPGAKRTSPEELPLGSWKRDNLHCAQDRCERWYEIEIEETGMLRVDLYAPAGSDLPDCEMQLETADGDPVAAHTGRVKTQRRLRHETGPASYRLRVASAGSNQELFDFEVVAELRSGTQSEKGSAPRTRPKSTSPPAPRKRPNIPRAKMPPPKQPAHERASQQEPGPSQPEAGALEVQAVEIEADPQTTFVPLPKPPPAPESIWIVAEVLDVEETDGEVSAVMVEAGVPDGIQPGMQGELFEGENTIGRIEVIDVYPAGSRARIVGPLAAPVSFDTLSRIEIPPDGE